MTKKFNFKNKQFWQDVYDSLLNELRELDKTGLIYDICVREDQVKAYLYEQFKKQGFLVEVEANILMGQASTIGLLLWSQKLGSCLIEIKRNAYCFSDTRISYADNVDKYIWDIQRLDKAKKLANIDNLIFIEIKFVDYSSNKQNSHNKYVEVFENGLDKYESWRKYTKYQYKNPEFKIHERKDGEAEICMEFNLWIADN